MDNISEQIFQAMEVIADDKLSKLKYDKTIQCSIFSIANLDIGEYKVRYNGNVFSAFAADLGKTFKVDDIVYVTVPEGDFSNKKIITSLVSELSLSYSLINNLKNSIKEISPTLDSFYGYDKTEVHGVVAGAPKNSVLSYEYIYEGPDEYSLTQFHGPFQQYASQYELIRIKASFLTQFHSTLSSGNYGLEVEFYTTGGTVKYKLDLSDFNGDPYRLTVYSPQSAVITAQKNYLLGLKSIKLFEENFEYDVHTYTLHGELVEKVNRNSPNIFVKDVEILYVEVVDLTDTSYYLNIATPKGSTFNARISSIDLLGQLIYQGNDIMDKKTCTCEWYERDLSIMIGSEEYNKDVGFGWKPYTKNVNFNLATISASEVGYQLKYKLYSTYNNVVNTAEVEVFNSLNGYGYHLEQITEPETKDIRLKIVNDNGTDVLKGDWYVSYPDGSYIPLDKNKDSILVKDYLLYTSETFYCAVYDIAGIKVIGTLEHTILNSESQDDVVIEYVGEDSFRYDANGDVAITDSEKERTLQVKLTWKEGFGTSYRIEWLGPDSKPIPTSKFAQYNPTNSMIKELWIDNSNILHYTILLKYKFTYNNNVIKVRVITVDQKIYEFNKEILFLKDGDQGTNGTTYVTAIRPCDGNGNKLSGFYPLIYNNGWSGYQEFKCYVYKDGDRIDTNPNFQITYTWTGINVSINGTSSPKNLKTTDKITVRGTSLVSGTASSQALQFYLKVKVDINDVAAVSKISIYASYPVDVLVGNMDKSLVDISDIPSYIKYTSSGLSPQYYNNEVAFTYNGVTYDGSRVDSLDTDLLKVARPRGETSGPYYLYPATDFIFEDNNIAVLKLRYSSTQYIIHPVVMYLDTYGNEAINGWDGTALDMGVPDENGKYHYLFAPQVGAGEKDELNRFTGVVMGKDSANDKIGLYGYQKGINTFGLMENGVAYFGAKSGGALIVIDGTTAEIYGGGNYPAGSLTGDVGGDAENGMSIYLANLKPTNPDRVSAIKISKGKFEVFYSGRMVATSAEIEGAIYATSGKIGGSKNKANEGWTIDTNRLYSGSGTTRVELNSNSANEYAIWAGSNTASNAKFSVKRDGTIKAAGDAYIKGEIVADKITANTQGNIAGWVINKQGLHNGRNIGLFSGSSSFNYYLVAGSNVLTVSADATPNVTVNESNAKFYVKRDGTIKATEGLIGTWNINSRGIYSLSSDAYSDTSTGTIGLFSRGTYFIAAGPGAFTQSGNNFSFSSDEKKLVFSVTRAGKMTCSGATINGGSIVINDNSGNKVFSASANSVFVKGRIEAGEGLIGGWRITSRGLFYGGYSDNDSQYEALSTFKLSTSNGGTFYIGQFSDPGDYSNTTSPYLRYSRGNLTISGTIRANELRFNGSSNVLDGDKLNGLYLKDGSVSGGKIANEAITAEKIKAGSITANEISANYVYAGKIKGSQIEAGTITAKEISADYVYTKKISGDLIEGGTIKATISLNGNIFYVGSYATISALGLASIEISAEQTTINDGTVYLPRGSMIYIDNTTLENYIKSMIPSSGD